MIVKDKIETRTQVSNHNPGNKKYPCDNHSAEFNFNKAIKIIFFIHKILIQ